MPSLPRGLSVLGFVVALAGAAQAATAAPSSMINVADDSTNAAIQQVIQHSNDEQVQAVATRNLSLMTDTLTDDHYQDLAGTLQSMLNHQVTGISLLKLDWGPITVAADGTSATATTFESWEIVSTAGTIDYDPVRNDYTLVPDNNGAWKIKADVQSPVPQPTPNTAGS